MNKICIRLRKDRTHAETIAIEVSQKHNPEKQIRPTYNQKIDNEHPSSLKSEQV